MVEKGERGLGFVCGGFWKDSLRKDLKVEGAGHFDWIIWLGLYTRDIGAAAFGQLGHKRACGSHTMATCAMCAMYLRCVQCICNVFAMCAMYESSVLGHTQGPRTPIS